MREYRDMTAGIYLREILPEDTGFIISWRNQKEVQKNFIYQETFTREGHENWMRTMVAAGKVAQMIICGLDGHPLGSVYLRDIDPVHRKAEYGIFIGEGAARGKGIGTAAAKLMICYGFKELKLHKIFLRALSDNGRALRSYEKAGFVREAYLKEDVRIDGIYRDVILMAVLNQE